MELPIQIAIFILSLFFLIRSADLMVFSIIKLSHVFHLGEFVTGVVVLGLATSSPEFFVGINSVAEHTPQLSLGNLMGATIILFSLLAGIGSVLSQGISTAERSSPRELLPLFTILTLPVLFLLDKSFTRPEAAFVILCYSVYTYREYKTKNRPPIRSLSTPPANTITPVIYALASFAVLVVSSSFLVKSTLFLATAVNVPPFFIGLLLLSLGTNLPEITLLLRAVKKHHRQLALGDIIGSATANTLIVGLIGFISPFSISTRTEFATATLFFFVTITTFLVFVHTRNHLSKKEGFALLFLYACFIVSEIFSRYLLTR